MSLLVDDIVVNPIEVPTIPARQEFSLSKMGLSIKGADFGESGIDGTAIRTKNGQVLTDRKGRPRTITLALIVREDSEVDLPTAAHNLQLVLGALQQRETWIRRDFHVGGAFAGPVLYRIGGEVSLNNFAGWQVGDSPDVGLTMSADFAAYSTEERENGPFESVAGERHLIFTEPSSNGTTDGFWRGHITNEGEEDWRGLIPSRECEDAPEDLEDPTAQLHYRAVDLTLRGGAVVATFPPELRAVAGGGTSGTGPVSPELPEGTKRGDLLIMIAESGGATAGAEADIPLTAVGWSSPPAPYADQKKGNTRLTILYRIATASDATSTNDTGDHQTARIIGIKAGTFDPENPFNTAAVGTQAATKSVSIPGATTTRDNCLVLACASGNLPDAASITEFGVPTNASLSELTERIDMTLSIGDGGALYAATGVKAGAGAYGATTLTAVTEAERVVASLAINPLPSVEHAALTPGWLTVLSSEIVAGEAGHMTHQGPRRVWLWVENPEPDSEVQMRLLCRTLGAARWDESLPIVTFPALGGWLPVNVGLARPQAASLGLERWEFKLLARAPAGAGKIRIRDVYPLSTEQYCVVSQSYDPPAAEVAAKRSPGTVESVAEPEVPEWAGASNAKTSDNSYAHASMFPGSEESLVSEVLLATGFGFAVPEDATITDVVVEIEKHGSNIRDNSVYLYNAGVAISFNHARSTSTGLTSVWDSSDNVDVYGGLDRDPSGGFVGWGTTLGPDVVNSATFGVGLRAETSVFATGNAYVDAISMTVYWTEEAAEDRVCFAGRSVEPRSDDIVRQHPTDDVWGSLVSDGFPPYVSAGGLEGKQARTILIPSTGDFQTIADSGTAPKLSAVTYSRDGYHFAREAG
jgi:hypothetical protein